MKPVTALLHQRGLRLIFYLDDTLLMAQSKVELRSFIKLVPQLLQLLGFNINWDKSVLSPAQRIQFLGFTVNSVEMSISLPREKVTKISQACRAMLRQPSTTVQELSRMIGCLTATVWAVIPAPLCYLQLQRLKNEAFRTSHSYSTRVILEPGARQDLKWWRDHLNEWNGKAVLPQAPDMFMKMDASLLGWGARCGDLQSGGLWTNKERSMHINCLELLGGVFAVKTFATKQQIPNPEPFTPQPNGNCFLQYSGG